MIYNNSHSRKCSREAKSLFATDVTQAYVYTEYEVGLRPADVTSLPAIRYSKYTTGDLD